MEEPRNHVGSRHAGAPDDGRARCPVDVEERNGAGEVAAETTVSGHVRTRAAR